MASMNSRQRISTPKVYNKSVSGPLSLTWSRIETNPWTPRAKNSRIPKSAGILYKKLS